MELLNLSSQNGRARRRSWGRAAFHFGLWKGSDWFVGFEMVCGGSDWLVKF